MLTDHSMQALIFWNCCPPCARSILSLVSDCLRTSVQLESGPADDSHQVRPRCGILRRASSRIPHRRFFSSSMADVALWLGPYMSISSKTSICTRTKTVWKCRQITTNQTTHKTSQTTRKSPSQTCVSSRETTNQTNKRGRSPNKNTHQKDLPKDTVV